MRVEITFDDREFREFLQAWQEPAVKRTLGAAASAFGLAAKPAIRAAIPVARPGNPYAKSAGNLRSLVRSKRFRAVRGIGVVIGPMGKAAFYRGWLTTGTKPHRIRFPDQRRRGVSKARGNIRHPGARPNPYIARSRDRAESAGMTAAERVIFRGLDAQRVSEAIDI